MGASSEDSADTNVGKAYVFTRSGTTWTEQIEQLITTTGPIGAFGNSVALSADGSTLAVGASAEDSNASGIADNQADNSAANARAVYLFR